MLTCVFVSRRHFYTHINLLLFVEHSQVTVSLSQLGVCRKPTDPPNPTQPNTTRRVGSVFKAWRVGLGYKNFFYSGLGWVWVIKFQTRQTQPNPPIYLIYIFKIYYIINKIFKITSSSYPI